MSQRPGLFLIAVVFSGCICGPLPSGLDAGEIPAGGRADAGGDAGPNAQERYTFAGCPDDGGSVGCARHRVFECALEAIRDKYALCQSPSDCVAVFPPNCIDAMRCPPAAVNDAGAFLSEVSVETERYCDGGGCLGTGACSRSYQRSLSDCIGGRCVAVQDDGGL